jgi:site-specific recombinase XerD
MEDFADYLSCKQLSYNVMRDYIRAAAHISRYALWEGVSELSEINEAFAYRFINEHLPHCTCERVNRGKYHPAVQGTWHLLQYLGEKGILSTVPEPLTGSGLCPKKYAVQKRYNEIKNAAASALPEQNAAQTAKASPPRTDLAGQEIILNDLPNSMGGIILRYDEYQASMFGLCQKTRDIHRVKTMLFLKWIHEKHGAAFRLSELNADDIIDFQKMCNQYGFTNAYRQTITSYLRGFLRFLVWERILEIDLTPAVYQVREWSLASTPKYIQYETANLLLTVPDRDTAKGKRDYLALLLMLRLGLRANEVIRLELSSISIESKTLTIRNTKSARERILPLSDEIVEAIVAYLLVRPVSTKENRVILRCVPPYKEMTNPSVLGGVVKQCIQQLKIETPTQGTHLLRNTLATHMVNNGATMKETADVLGHISIQTTGIYAKVQMERLKGIAMPYPCHEEVCA